MHPAKKSMIRLARGFRGRAKNCWTLVQRAVHHAWQKSYTSRRLQRRDYRSEWIQRINAGSRQFGMRYSEVVRGLPAAGIELNRRVLSELAATEPFTFRALVEASRAQLEAEKEGRRRAAAEELR
jgi:large subunit ribosomal protein L20